MISEDRLWLLKFRRCNNLPNHLWTIFSLFAEDCNPRRAKSKAGPIFLFPFPFAVTEDTKIQVNYNSSAVYIAACTVVASACTDRYCLIEYFVRYLCLLQYKTCLNGRLEPIRCLTQRLYIERSASWHAAVISVVNTFNGVYMWLLFLKDEITRKIKSP